MATSQTKLQQGTKTSISNWLRKHRWLKRTVIIVVIVYIASLFTPFLSGYTQFPLYLIKCWGLPVEATRFAAGYTYELPSDKGYNRGLMFVTDYFCSEKNAQTAGFHRDPLEY